MAYRNLLGVPTWAVWASPELPCGRNYGTSHDEPNYTQDGPDAGFLLGPVSVACPGGLSARHRYRERLPVSFSATLYLSLSLQDTAANLLHGPDDLTLAFSPSSLIVKLHYQPEDP